MKYLKEFKIYESQDSIYYHGRSGTSPYKGNYIYLTDNIAYASKYSDNKTLYKYKLKTDNIFSFKKLKDRKVLKENIGNYIYDKILNKLRNGEIDWSVVDYISNNEYESPDELLQSLGYKGMYLGERVAVNSIWLFDQEDAEFVGKVDISNKNNCIMKENYNIDFASGIILYCKENNKFLLGLRSGGVHEPHTWAGFGGMVEPRIYSEENFKESAIRELEEEIGYIGDIKLEKIYVHEDYEFEYHNYIGIIDYVFTPKLNWEHDEVKWISYEDILSMDNLHSGLIEVLNNKKEFFEKNFSF